MVVNISFLIVALFATVVWAAMLTAANGSNIAYVAPLAIVAMGVAAWTMYAGMLRRAWALLTILAFALIACGIVFRTREQGAASLDEQNGIKVLTWMVMLGLCVVNYRSLLGFGIDPVILAWALFGIVGVVSTLYSSVPTVSLMSALSVLIYLGFSCLLAANVPMRQILMVTVWALAVYLAINWIVSLALPDVAWPIDEYGERRFAGLAGHSNTMGNNATILLIFVLYAFYHGDLRATWSIPLTVLSGVTIYLSQSRGALFSVLLALALQARRLLYPLIAVAIIVGVVIVISGQTDAVLSLIGREGDIEEASTMSGRTELWAFVWNQIKERPVLGYGYNSFESNAVDLWYGMDRRAGVATHNNFLETLYSVGFIGALPYFIAVLLSTFRFLRQPYFLRDLMFLYIIIHAFTEVDITTIAVLPTMTFFMVLAMDTVASGKLHLQRNSLARS